MLDVRVARGFGIALCLTAFFGDTTSLCDPEILETHIVSPDGQSRHLSLEVATTRAARARGLMYRRQLADNRGMIFVFPDTRIAQMWMTNTPRSLDILFLDSDRIVVNVVPNTTPNSNEIISSVSPVRYAIEVKAGTAVRLDIRPGSQLLIKTPPGSTN